MKEFNEIFHPAVTWVTRCISLLWIFNDHHCISKEENGIVAWCSTLSRIKKIQSLVGISLHHHSSRKTSQDLKIPICCEVTTFLSVIEGLIWECQNHFQKLKILGSFKRVSNPYHIVSLRQSFCHLHQSYEF